MTQPKSGTPEPSEHELLALYHEASDAEPGSLLDQRILAAAKAELLLDHKRFKRSAPWWKSLLVPVTTLAIGVLGVSLTWHVVDQREQELRTITSQMDDRDNAGDAAAQRAPEKSMTEPSPVTQESKELRLDTKAVSKPALPEAKKSSPARQDEAKGQTQPLDSARFAEPAPPVAATPMPMAVPQTVQPSPAQERSADSEAPQVAGEIGESSRTAKAEMAAPAAKRRLDDRRAESADSSDNSAAGAGIADDGATPEAWLKHIRELQSAGRNAEAAQSLARFRVRYPDHVLPADLLHLK